MRKTIVLYTAIFSVLFGGTGLLWAANETRISGTLHPGEFYPYLLEADERLYVLKGSRSEAQTNIVKLEIPAKLSEGAKNLYEKHVVVVGQLECTGNWASGASCHMLVKQIYKEEKVTGAAAQQLVNTPVPSGSRKYYYSFPISAFARVEASSDENHPDYAWAECKDNKLYAKSSRTYGTAKEEITLDLATGVLSGSSNSSGRNPQADFVIRAPNQGGDYFAYMDKLAEMESIFQFTKSREAEKYIASVMNFVKKQHVAGGGGAAKSSRFSI